MRLDGVVTVAVQVEGEQVREDALARWKRLVDEMDAQYQRMDHGGGQAAVRTYPGQKQLPVGRKLLDPRSTVAADLLLGVRQDPGRVKIADCCP